MPIFERTLMVLNYIFSASIPFTHIPGYAVCAITLALSFSRAKDIIRLNPVRLMLVFIVYGIALSLFSQYPLIGLQSMLGYTLHWFMPFLLGYSVTSSEKFRKIFGLFALLMAIILIFSLLAYFGYFYKTIVFPDYYLVYDNLLKAFHSHISLAALCLLLLNIGLGVLLYETILTNRSRLLLIGVTAAIITVSLILTGSRGYYIAGFLNGLGLSIWYGLSRKKVWHVLVAFSAVALTAFAVISFNPALSARISTTSLKTNNVSERLSLYKVALIETAKRPLFGFGPGQGIKQVEYFSSLEKEMQGVSRHPSFHSFYLNLAADFGLCGLGLFLSMIFLIEKYIWKLHLISEKGFVKALSFGVFWGTLALLAGDCFDTLLRGPGIAMEFFWLFGFLVHQYQIRSGKV